MKKPEKSTYIKRGIIGGVLLGGLAWLAVYRGRGGRLTLMSGEFEGVSAFLVVLVFGLIAGAIVAGAAYTMMSVLSRNVED